MRLPRLPFPASKPTIWAVEDDAVQITWGSLRHGPVRAVTVDEHDRMLGETSIDHRGGPGAVIVTGLPADRGIRVRLHHRDGTVELEARTLAPPPGRLVAKFATISDMHLGSDHFGFFKRMRDRTDHHEPFAFRSASGAVSEALDWGATSIVIKGDAAHHGDDRHFAEVGRLVDHFPDVPFTLIPGNHDVDLRGGHPLPATVGSRAVPYLGGVDHVDLPHLRLVFADTTIETKGAGTLRDVRHDLLDRAASAHSAAMVVIHQQLQEHNQVRYWPPGIRGDEATSFLSMLAAANPNSIVTSGHTHRNRRRHHESIVVTEVAATHHWPAVWAGYAVHEGGVRQVVRRITSNDTLDWHEYSKNAVLGVWGLYAPGRRDDRCFSHGWS